jgi:hypothetical protein
MESLAVQRRACAACLLPPRRRELGDPIAPGAEIAETTAADSATPSYAASRQDAAGGF